MSPTLRSAAVKSTLSVLPHHPPATPVRRVQPVGVGNVAVHGTVSEVPR